MSGTKISAAADITSLNSTDMLPVARSGSTTAYHATMAEVSTYANTNLPTATTAVLGAVKVDGSTVTISGGTISTAPSSTATPAMDGAGSAGSATAWSRGDHVHPSDTTRAPLASPTFTGSPAAPTPTTGDNSTKLATTAFVQAQMVASGAGVSTFNTRAGAVVLQQSDLAALGEYNDTGRNLVHNGQMAIAQRGAGPWTTNGVYTLDRWYIRINIDTASFSQGSFMDTGRAQVGDESALNYLNNVFTGNAAAAATNMVSQLIENVRSLSAKTVTVSFWASAASGTPKLGVSIDQYFGTGGSPSAMVTGSGQAVTLSTTWTRYSLTFAIPSVSGKTTGTNNDHATYLNFWYSSGATNATRSGNVGVQSNTVSIWGVQLEIGSMATALAKRDPADELALCQRFYQTITNYLAAGYVPVATWVYGTYGLPVTMRATPSVGFSGVVYSNASGILAAGATASNVVFSINATAAGSANANGTATLSADL